MRCLFFGKVHPAGLKTNGPRPGII